MKRGLKAVVINEMDFDTLDALDEKRIERISQGLGSHNF